MQRQASRRQEVFLIWLLLTSHKRRKEGSSGRVGSGCFHEHAQGARLQPGQAAPRFVKWRVRGGREAEALLAPTPPLPLPLPGRSGASARRRCGFS